MNGAVLLAGRTCRDGLAGAEIVLAHELEEGMAGADQARKLLAQAGVDALEGILEARTCLAVDAPHGLCQRIERRGEIGELTVEVLLALTLLAQLVDGGEVHGAEPFDVGAC